MSRLRWPARLTGIALLAGALLAAALLWLEPHAWQRFLQTPSRLPSPASNLTLIDIHGNKITLASLRGKVLIVNFWSPGCAPCLKEMPVWVNARQTYSARGLEVLAISMPSDAPNHVIAFAENGQLPFPVILDLIGEANLAFGGVQVMPTTFLVNRNGQVVHKFIGIPPATELQAALQSLL